MNVNMVVSIIIGAACYASGFLIENSQLKNYRAEVANGLDNEVFKKFGLQTQEAKAAFDIAKADAQKIYNKEIAATKAVVETNPEYVAAKTTIDSNYERINTLKKTLKSAKQGNTTSVAVANGNSSVAVSVKDTARINQIETDISNLQKEIRQQESIRTRIWKTERDKMSVLRTESEKAVISNVKEAEKAVDRVKFESELYKNELRDNPDFMDNLKNRAFLNNYSPIRSILSTVLVTFPLAATFVWFWKDTISMVKLYFTLRKGVAVA